MKYDGGEIRLRDIDFSILDELKLEDQPVGIKFLLKKPEGVRKLDKSLAFCLMPEEAQRSGVFYADNTNFGCGGLCLGIEEDDPIKIAGQLGTKSGLDIFQEARANRRIYEELPSLKHNTCNYVVFSPLNEMGYDPDVLLITGTARQAEIVLRAYVYSTGNLYVSKTSPVLGCAWTFIYPYISGKLNYVVEGICFGHIARQVSTPGYITIAIPFNWTKTIMDNLKEMTWILPSYLDGREGYDKRLRQTLDSQK